MRVQGTPCERYQRGACAMSKRCIVNVATGRFVKGQQRLIMNRHTLQCPVLCWTDVMPPKSPSHLDVPFAFKAWAIAAAIERGCTSILWADACILPISPLEPLWERIEQDGYWISRNGWTNAEWTAENVRWKLGVTQEENEQIPHVVATSFGLCVDKPVGKNIFEEYLSLAQNGSFCGPWWNSNHPEYSTRAGAHPCGGSKVRGHRHDQTALSVIAHKQGCKLTDPPHIFAYAGGQVEGTILLADGAY